MHLTTSLLSALPSHGSAVLVAFDPGQGTAPPGVVAGDLDTIVSWVAWTVFSVAIIAMLAVAGHMMLSHRRGQGSDAGASLGYVLGGVVLAASASAIVGVLV
jgi:hypothetical protein